MTTLAQEQKEPLVLRPGWKWYDALAIFFLSFGVLTSLLITALLVGKYMGIFTSREDFTITQMTLFMYSLPAGIAIAFMAYNRLRHQYSWQMSGFRRPTKGWVWRTVAASILANIAFIVALLIVAIIGVVFEMGFIESEPVGNVESLQNAVEFGGMTAVLGVLLTAILIPIVEEFLFRGVIHNALRQRFGFWVSAIVSSAIFGVMHIVPLAILNAFIAGIFLAWLYEKSDSLWPPILMHALRNGMIALVLILTIWG